jgi:hypothetical protein
MPLSTIFAVISWWSVLLVEETAYLEKTTDLLQVTDNLQFITDMQVDFLRWQVPDLKGYLQQRGITCHLYRKPDLVKLCELACTCRHVNVGTSVGDHYANK